MHEIVPILVGGLVLFLYSITQLSVVMRDFFSERATEIIGNYTRNIYFSIIIGTFLTILLGSSSAVIILAIVFINAEQLRFKQAIGIILGANIGTTFSSQLIALDIGKYSIIPLGLGLLLYVFSNKERTQKIGKFLLYFGMLFFGLYLMENSVLPLRESAVFEKWIVQVEQNYFKGALIGGLITLIIQSSSGTVGIAILLGKKGLLSVAGGIAIMLGAELGTCSDTLLATINGSRQALKAGLFHLIFNILTISVGLLVFWPFVRLVEWLFGHQDIGALIANAHMMFNILGVVLFLPFISIFERALNYFIPSEEA